MAQFARPSTDTTLGNWTDAAAGTTSIFQSIDESSANDSDFIQSAEAPATDIYVTKLTTVTDPVSSSGHIVRYRYGKNTNGGAQIDLTVQLRQGYTNEGAPGTLIASSAHTDIAVVPTAGTFTLSGAEADSITDYTSLYLRLVANQV